MLRLRCFDVKPRSKLRILERESGRKTVGRWFGCLCLPQQHPRRREAQPGYRRPHKECIGGRVCLPLYLITRCRNQGPGRFEGWLLSCMCDLVREEPLPRPARWVEAVAAEVDMFPSVKARADIAAVKHWPLRWHGYARGRDRPNARLRRSPSALGNGTPASGRCFSSMCCTSWLLNVRCIRRYTSAFTCGSPCIRSRSSDRRPAAMRPAGASGSGALVYAISSPCCSLLCCRGPCPAADRFVS